MPSRTGTYSVGVTPVARPERADRLNPRIALAYVRSNVKAGWQRVRGAVVPNTQSAVFATFSWVICHYLLGAPNPIFAPIATFLCLGFSRNREPRKVLEVGLGATLGVFIGEVVTDAIGFGWWQLLLLLLTTPLLGRLLDSADLLTFQTAINSIVVGSMIQIATATHTSSAGAPLGRWVYALIGVAVALVGAVVLPRSLTSRPRRYTATALGGIADALEAIAHGLRTGDVGRIKVAYARLVVARDQLEQGRAAQKSASDMAQLNPARRGDRQQLAELDRLLRLADRLHGSVFMLARQAAGMTGETGPLPVIGELTEQTMRALRDLSRQVGRWERPDRAREEALATAARLEPDSLEGAPGWRNNALVSLLRAVTVDLLQLSGLSVPQARAALPDTGDLDVRSEDADALPDEEGSELWGTTTFPAVKDRQRPDRHRPR